MDREQHISLADPVMKRFLYTEDMIDPDVIAEDAVWVVGGSSGDPFAGRYEGKAAILEGFKVHEEAVHINKLDVIHYLIDGNKNYYCR